MIRRSENSRDWRTKPHTSASPIRKSRPNNSRSPDLQRKASGWRDLPKTVSISPGPEHLRGEDDARTLKAIEEGRRLYVGNMPYMAKREDVESLFASHDYQIEHINISIDPYTGRNPSYCFIELATKAQADQAIKELCDKHLLGRPVKLGLGVASAKTKKKTSTSKSGHQYPSEQPVFQRWTRTDAPDHFEGYSAQGRRLWVGGLPEMGHHDAVNTGVRELFAGFDIEAVSKVVIPRYPPIGDPKARNHRYLFVDFASAEEASRAVQVTDGRYAWGVKIRVQVANIADSRKVRERDEWDQEHLVLDY